MATKAMAPVHRSYARGLAMPEPSHPHEPRRYPMIANRAPVPEPDPAVEALAGTGVDVGAGPDGAPLGRRRAILPAVAVAVGVGLAIGALTYSVIALPLYLLAEFDADGLDRPLVRDAFFGVAVPVGLVVGLVAGIVVGVALARGGRLPTDRTSFHER